MAPRATLAGAALSAAAMIDGMQRAEALEAAGELAAAFDAYRELIGTGGDPRELSARMGRLALALGEPQLAETLFGLHLQCPGPQPQAVAGLAQAQSAQGAFDRAHATLKTALEGDSSQPVLWLALARLLMAEGRHPQATVFVEEALRLDPGSSDARDALAEVLLITGEAPDRVLDLSAEALAAAGPDDLPWRTAAHARRLLALGRLDEGWPAFAAFTAPGPAGGVCTRAAAPPWTGDLPVAGRILVFGESATSDEILLAHVLPTFMAAGASVVMAVDPRWLSLAERSFPGALAVPRLQKSGRARPEQAAALDSPHLHRGELISGWTTLRALAAAHRKQPADFPGIGPYLRPDPARVAHWRTWLGGLGPGPKLGLQWRTAAGAPAAPMPTIQELADVLSDDLVLVSLQDRDTPGETAQLKAIHGLDIREPPGLAHDDLDDLAALAAALDVVVGPPDTAACLAAGLGAATWLLAPPRHWALLGDAGFPWSPSARVFVAAAPRDWTDALAGMAGAVAALPRR